MSEYLPLPKTIGATLICMIRQRLFQLLWDVAVLGAPSEYMCETHETKVSPPLFLMSAVMYFIRSLGPLQPLEV